MIMVEVAEGFVSEVALVMTEAEAEVFRKLSGALNDATEKALLAGRTKTAGSKTRAASLINEAAKNCRYAKSEINRFYAHLDKTTKSRFSSSAVAREFRYIEDELDALMDALREMAEDDNFTTVFC